jgi:hypothetical protein
VLVEHRPAVDPVDAGEEGLAAEDVVARGEAGGAHGEVDGGPFA